MNKIICLVFCVVAGLNCVHGIAEDKVAIMSAVKPFVEECAKKYGVTLESLLAAKASGKIEDVEPCFYGCVYKKTEFLNNKGEYDVDTALAKLKKYISNDDDYTKLSQIGKDCASVNTKPVGDGEAGCERAKLLTQCFLDHKGSVPM